MILATDDDLLAGLRAGSPDWEGIYRAYRRVMWAAARRVLGDPDRSYEGTSVEDVVQLAMLEVRAKGIDPDVRSIPKYLATVAARRALNAMRPGPAVLTSTGTLPDVEPDADEVERVVVQWAQIEEVRRHLVDLSAGERHALLERVMKARPARDVGGELGVTPQRVSQLVTSALRKLRSVIEAEAGGDRT